MGRTRKPGPDNSWTKQPFYFKCHDYLHRKIDLWADYNEADKVESQSGVMISNPFTALRDLLKDK